MGWLGASPHPWLAEVPKTQTKAQPEILSVLNPTAMPLGSAGTQEHLYWVTATSCLCLTDLPGFLWQQGYCHPLSGGTSRLTGFLCPGRWTEAPLAAGTPPVPRLAPQRQRW